jgi:hypothetical protein
VTPARTTRIATKVGTGNESQSAAVFRSEVASDRTDAAKSGVGAPAAGMSHELAALDIFFDGLLVDFADWFELLRDHRQGRIQVDEAPGLCARAYGAVIRIAGARSMLPDPLS